MVLRSVVKVLESVGPKIGLINYCKIQRRMIRRRLKKSYKTKETKGLSAQVISRRHLDDPEVFVKDKVCKVLWNCRCILKVNIQVFRLRQIIRKQCRRCSKHLPQMQFANQSSVSRILWSVCYTAINTITIFKWIYQSRANVRNAKFGRIFSIPRSKINAETGIYVASAG